MDEGIYKINLSKDEKIVCLQEIISKLKKILYVYEKSLEPNSNYKYKVYCGGIAIYISSSNILFNNELVDILSPYLSELEAMNDGTTLQSVGLYNLYDALNTILGAYEEATREEKLMAEGLQFTKEQYDELIATAPELKNQILQ